jgi:hypothetical protein
MPPTLTTYYPMAGGLDLVTPSLQKSPGRCIDALNYEPTTVGGYRRINGYERFDGRPSPTAASIQREIDGYYEAFKAAVVRGRPQLKKSINELADGTVKVGRAAVESGLLDGLAKIEAVIEAMNRKYG